MGMGIKHGIGNGNVKSHSRTSVMDNIVMELRLL